MKAVAVNHRFGSVLLEDGTSIKFNRMYAAGGIETDDISDAMSAIYQAPDGMWNVIRFSDFEKVSTH